MSEGVALGLWKECQERNLGITSEMGLLLFAVMTNEVCLSRVSVDNYVCR